MLYLSLQVLAKLQTMTQCLYENVMQPSQSQSLHLFAIIPEIANAN